MRLGHTLLVVAVVLLTRCDSGFGNIGLSKMGETDFARLEDEVSAENQIRRNLRGHEEAATAEDEDRTFDFKKVFDFKKIFGLRNVPKDFAKGLVNEFSKATLKEMVRNEKFRFVVYKKWDKVKLDELVKNIGQSTLRNKRVAEMFVEYKNNYRKYRWT